MAALLFIVRPANAADEPATDRAPVDDHKFRGSNPVESPQAVPVPALISRLGDSRYEVREEATRSLEQAAAGAIAALHEAAAGENLEVTCRAIQALASILNTNDEATFDAAEGALEQLEFSTNRSAARRAGAALASQSFRRWKRAVTRLNKLGAGVKTKERAESGLPESIPELAGMLLPTHVIVKENWNGGSAGLINIKRLVYSLQSLVISRQIPPLLLPLPVYVIDGANVSPEALEELQQALPGLEIQPRGRARLGVSCLTRTERCVISDIEANSAAHKAGLRRGDIIVRYDGESLENFDQLTKITRRHNVADRVKLEVDRDSEIVEIEAVLSGWDDPEPMPQAK